MNVSATPLPTGQTTYSPQAFPTITVTPIGVTQAIGDLRAFYGARADQYVGTGPEQIVEASGRKCYQSNGRGRPSGAFHQNLIEERHGSVAAHPVFNFDIRGISRNLTHELIRHHVGTAVSQESTRYVDIRDRIVPGLRNLRQTVGSELAGEIADHLGRARVLYGQLVDGLLGDAKDRAKVKAVRTLAAQLMPHGHTTEIVWSANIRALRNVIEQRGDAAAAPEINALAWTLHAAARDLAPAWFGDYAVDGDGSDSLTTPWRKI